MIGWLMLIAFFFYLVPAEYKELVEYESYDDGSDPIFPTAYTNEHDNYMFKASMFSSMDE